MLHADDDDDEVAQITHDDIQDGVLTLSPSQLSTHPARQIRALKCNVKVVISGLPESRTTFPDWFFTYCRNITFVTLPAGLTTIGQYAFRCCTSLTQITLPASLTTIGRHAFYGCTSLTQLTLPAGLTTIGDVAFGGCSSLTQLTLPAGLTTIGEHAFRGCTSLTHLTLPVGLTRIGESAFRDCTSLTQVTLPEGLMTIGGGSFGECTSLTQLILPAGLATIGDVAFFRCTSLTQVTMPAGLTTIGQSAFSGCRSLTQLTMPDSITRIHSDAFDGCPYDLTIGITSTDEQAFDEVITQIPATYRGRVIAFRVTAPQEQYRRALHKELLAETFYSLTSTFKLCYIPLACTSKFFHPEDRYDLQPMNHGVNDGISFSNQVFGTAPLAGHINSFIFDNHHRNSEVVELRAKIYEVLYQIPLLNDDDPIIGFKQSMIKVITAQFPDHADAVIAKFSPDTVADGPI